MELTPSKTHRAVGGIMDWSQILYALAAALMGFVVAVVAGTRDLVVAWLERLAKGERRLMADRIGKMAAYMEALEAARLVPCVDRIIVFRGMNGGGLPSPGKPYSIKGLHGWARDRKRNPASRYNFDMPVDAYASRLIEQIIKDGVVDVAASLIPEDAAMHAYYAAEGVIASRLYFLRIDGNETLYLSLASFDSGFSDRDRAEMDLVANRIRAALK